MALALENMDCHIRSRPFKGEKRSGDMGFLKNLGDKLFIAAIDVAGHGENAANLAMEIRDFLDSDGIGELSDMVNRMHLRFKGSRGFAGSFLILDLGSKAFDYVGIGNVNTRVLGRANKRMVNRSGVIGYILPSVKVKTYEWSDSDVLVLYSDGVKEHFELETVLDLGKMKASAISERILKDFGKTADDALCIVVKYDK